MRDRARRLVLGDWSRLVRDPIDLLRLSYVAGAVILATLGDGEAVRMAAGAALVFVARRADLPRAVDLMLCIGVGFEVVGQAFDLYASIPWWDILVHFMLPLLVAPLAYIVPSRAGIVPDLKEEARRHHNAGIWFITFCVVVAFGATLWEIIEYVSDEFLGTQLSFGYADAVGDMAATTAGAAVGGLWLVAWSERQWGTRRRPVEKRVVDRVRAAAP